MNITIEQPKWYDGIVATALNREEITSLILSNMYAAAMDVNNTVSYEGYLYCPSGYWSQAEWLMNQFSDLKIEIPANGRYLLFLDPEVLRVLLANNWGDGVGITMSAVLAKTALSQDMFKNNTTLVSFNELGSMTTIVELKQDCFRNCSNLENLDLSNITIINNGALAGTSKLLYINLPNVVTIKEYVFQDPTNTLTVDLGPSLSTIGHVSFKNDWKGTLIMRSTTPPTITGGTSPVRLYNQATIYVPHDYVDVYKQDTTWSVFADRIHSLNEYTQS